MSAWNRRTAFAVPGSASDFIHIVAMKKIPRKEHASEKVRKYSPSSKEKGTLLAMAYYGQPDGTRIFVSKERLAVDTGQSERTIQRHLQALQLPERDELRMVYSAGIKHRCPEYMIPLCAASDVELAERNGLSKNQLKLPLVQRDQSESGVPEEQERYAHLVACGVRLCPGGGDKLSPLGRQSVSLPWVNMGLKGGSGDNSFRNGSEGTGIDGPVPISPETIAFYKAEMEKLKPEYVVEKKGPERPLDRVSQMYVEERGEHMAETIALLRSCGAAV